MHNLKKCKFLFSMNILFITLENILNVYLAILIKDLIDAAVQKDMILLKRIIIYILLLATVAHLIIYLKNIFKSLFIKKTNGLNKKYIFESIINFNIQDYLNYNMSKFISIFNNDIKVIETDYYSNIFNIYSGVVSFIMASIVLIHMNIYIYLAAIIASILLLVIPQLLVKKLSYLNRDYLNKLADLTNTLKDLFSGFEVIKTFNIEDEAVCSFLKIDKRVNKSQYEVNKLNSLLITLSSYLGVLVFLMVMLTGSYLAAKGKISVGELIGSIQLINNLVQPIQTMSINISNCRAGKKIYNDIDELCSSNLEKNVHLEETNYKFNEKIEFKNVYFSYNKDKEALKNINITINKGDKIAIIGKSGSGKTTLLKLLLKYYNNFKGDILIDDISINEISAGNLYKLISIIQQNTFVFNDTIKNNICLYNEFKQGDFDNAVKNSELNYFIDQHDEKENYVLDENGKNLSGGEKQRISIARSLIRNTPIMLLDESFSAIDKITSKKIENSLLDMNDLTLISVTHKMDYETLSRYDNIIILNNGEIVESGSLEELISNKLYFCNLL